MMIITRGFVSLAIMAAITGAALAPIPARAQAAIPPLPASALSQLQAPGANVQQVSVSIADVSPALSTSVLQASVGVLGALTENAPNEVLAFANHAKDLISPGAGRNPALAAAFAVSVENIVGDPQNAAMVNGPYALTVAQAKAIADAVLQGTDVQQAILDGAPGTGSIVQAAAGGFGGFGGANGGGGGAGGGSGTSSPATP